MIFQNTSHIITLSFLSILEKFINFIFSISLYLRLKLHVFLTYLNTFLVNLRYFSLTQHINQDKIHSKFRMLRRMRGKFIIQPIMFLKFV